MHSENEVVNLHLDDIIPNRFQPREVFDEKALKELAVSIKEHGVIHPIIVREINGKYEIIAGERRYKASALAGLTKIPAIVRKLDDKESSKIALLENLQRRNLNPIEEARTYQKILELDQLTQEELAKTMGKSQSAVANKLRLLSLSDDVQKALLKEQISERHARTLLNIQNPDEQKEMLNKVINNKMTVRQLENEIKGVKTPPTQDDDYSDSDDGEEKTIPVSNNLISNDFDNKLNLPKDNFVDNQFFSAKDNDIKTEEENKPTNTFFNSENNDTPAVEVPKFINYGEINDEEDKTPTDLGFGFNNSSAPIDLNELKSNTRDIKSEPSEENQTSLDSLLNISSQQTSSNNSDNKPEKEDPSYKFFAPPKDVTEEDKKIPEQTIKKPEDYFKEPSLIESAYSVKPETKMEEPSTHSTDSFNALKDQFNIPLTKESNKESLNEAISMIKDQLNNIKQKGIKVETDEMNFKNSYQIIIKLEKEQ